jgi:phospholipid transport system transporter-binding protein
MIELSDGRYLVQGPLTLATVQQMLLHSEPRFDGNDIRIDLSGVSEADSSAVGLLLAWTRAAAARGGRIRFENLPGNLSALIKLYEVGELLPGA